MKKPNDDELFNELFDEADAPAPVAAAPATKPAPAKPAAHAVKATPKVAPAPETAPANIEDVMGRDAAQMFSEIMAGSRRAEAVTQPAPPVVQQEEEPLRIHTSPSKDEPVRATFGDSVAPWTLFRGASVLGMLAYIVGFHGKQLSESWVSLLVVTTALTAAILLVDFVRLAPQAQQKKRGPK